MGTTVGRQREPSVHPERGTGYHRLVQCQRESSPSGRCQSSCRVKRRGGTAGKRSSKPSWDGLGFVRDIAPPENPLPRLHHSTIFIKLTPAPPRSAPNDLPDPAQIRSTLQHLRHLRLAKIRTALRPPPPSNTRPPGGGGDAPEEPDTGAFSGRGEYMSLTGFTVFEVMQMRGMFGGVLGMLGRLSGDEAAGEGMEVDQ